MAGAAAEDKSYFERFCDYMRRDTKGVEVCRRGKSRKSAIFGFSFFVVIAGGLGSGFGMI